MLLIAAYTFLLVLVKHFPTNLLTGGIMPRVKKYINPDLIELTFNMSDGSVTARYPDDEFCYPLDAFDADGDEKFEQVNHAIKDYVQTLRAA